jgi:hypothetical protein
MQSDFQLHCSRYEKVLTARPQNITSVQQARAWRCFGVCKSSLIKPKDRHGEIAFLNFIKSSTTDATAPAESQKFRIFEGGIHSILQHGILQSKHIERIILKRWCLHEYDYAQPKSKFFEFHGGRRNIRKSAVGV